eukprot:gene9689-13042_t
MKRKIMVLKDLTTTRMLVIRGFITWSMNIYNHKWKRCHDSKRDRGYFSSVYYKGEVYAIGTYSIVAAGTVEKYNPFIDKWCSVANMPRKYRSISAAVLKDNMYVLGGIDSHTEIVSDEIYSYHDENTIPLHPNNSNNNNYNNNTNSRTLRSQHWLSLKLYLLRPRYRHSSIGFKDKIWVIGGCFDDHQVTNTVEIVDPLSGVVVSGPSMVARREFGNLLIVNEVLYAVGGDMDHLSNLMTRTIEKFDSSLNKWIHVTTFKDERRGFSTCSYESKIYIFGGSSEHDYDLNTWDAFDVIKMNWASDEVTKSQSSLFKMPLIDTWGQAVTYPPKPLNWTREIHS